MSNLEHRTDLALAMLASASIDGILWIAKGAQ
jgi:hypothetical protein